MSSSSRILLGYDGEDNLRFVDKRAAIEYIERLESSHNFCDWCHVPLRGETSLDDLPLQTCRTFDSRTSLTEDVPPDQVDEYGGVVEVSRDSLEICSCGWIDVPPGQNRDEETTIEHMENILALLEENGADVNQHTARAIAREELTTEGRTGQFCQVVGEAIYYALEDS